ncbi:MAG: hypothetical protein U9R19_07655 [Bacteroidota bacterium]|nr:hypothetical protein [Bacteroidota bacterium]
MKQAILSIAIIYIPILAFLQTTESSLIFMPDSNYVEIPGTRVSLFPPDGFYKANKFAGLKNPEYGASIMIAEMDKAFHIIKDGFTKEGFASQGMDLLNNSLVFIGNEKALLYKARKKSGDIQFSKWILIFGNDTSTIMISGTFPDSFDSNMSGIIENCLLSAHFNPGKKISSEASLGFSINTKETKLKFAKSFPGTLVYTVDGNFPCRTSDGATLKIGSSLGKVEIENPRKYVLERLNALPYLIQGEPQLMDIKIDNLSGYEIIAYGVDKTSGINILIYQVFLFSHSSYYLLLGTAHNNFDSNLKLFIDVVSNFKRARR